MATPGQKLKNVVAITLLCIAAAIGFGIIHDQITVRICAAYFTVGHPPVFPTDDPTLLALGWGVLATWWVGMILGVALGVANVVGRRPMLPALAFRRPLAWTLIFVAATALLAGVAGNISAKLGWVSLSWPMRLQVPEKQHVAFMTDLWAHAGSYVGGAVAGIALCVTTLKKRSKLGRSQVPEQI